MMGLAVKEWLMVCNLRAVGTLEGERETNDDDYSNQCRSSEFGIRDSSTDRMQWHHTIDFFPVNPKCH
jgi:hypothetical protein